VSAAAEASFVRRRDWVKVPQKRAERASRLCCRDRSAAGHFSKETRRSKVYDDTRRSCVIAALKRLSKFSPTTMPRTRFSWPRA